jgi:hypothetical protein
MTYQPFSSLTAFVALVLLTGCGRETAGTGANTPAANFAPPAAAATPVSGTPSTAPGTHRADQLPADASAAPVAADVRQPVQRSTAVSRSAEDDRPRYVTKRRSKKKSAAIIGGSAGAGAAIGALAGGGKGAGIGAIAGGVGGLIYDRKTAKKRERID